MWFDEKVKYGFKILVLCALFLTLSEQVKADEKPDYGDYPEEIRQYFENIFREGQNKYAFRENYPGGFLTWQKDIRPFLKKLIGLEKIRSLASSIGIEEIIEDSRAIKIRMSENTMIKPDLLVSQIEKSSKISIDRKEKDVIIFRPEAAAEEKRLEELKKWLQQISAPNNKNAGKVLNQS